jgi:hypothetical protein
MHSESPEQTPPGSTEGALASRQVLLLMLQTRGSQQSESLRQSWFTGTQTQVPLPLGVVQVIVPQQSPLMVQGWFLPKQHTAEFEMMPLVGRQTVPSQHSVS